MSGIVGVVGDVDDLEYRLAAMLQSIKHRGECERGFWVSSFVESRLGLAHCGRVESEVEEDVKQPFVDEDEQMVVVMDGDIYNHRELRKELQAYYVFATDSSVELLSKAYRRWGVGCFARLNGAFAVALYDRRVDVLIMARDRFGIKPLYYATHRGNIFFGSEIKSLFSAGIYRRISPERWAAYMLYGSYGPPYSTFWEGVHQLPAGCFMSCNGYSLSEQRWYDIRNDIRELVLSYEAEEMRAMFVSELRSCVEQSMSNVSSCAVRVAGRIETQLLHSIAMHGDNSWKIRAFTSDVYNVAHRALTLPVWITALQAIDELEGMMQWSEEPFDGSETIMRTILFRSVRRNGIRVACSGLGLDVLWQDVWDVGCSHYSYLYPHKLFLPIVSMYAQKPVYEKCFVDEDANLRYFELAYERIPHMLRVFDMSAAKAGVSVRIPFLDGRLVALSFALPIVDRQHRKSIFTRCMMHSFDAIERYKTESLLPMWKRGGLCEWVADSIEALSVGDMREWFDVKRLYSLRDAFCDGRCVDIDLLWRCLSLHAQLGEK